MIKKISFLVLLAFSISIFSQNSEKSPYSIFGVGDQYNKSTVSSLAMGGMGITLNHTYELNFTNPALLNEIRLTSFDLGAQTKFITLDDGNNQVKSSNSTLSYLALGFPIIKNMGFMLGFQPNTNVGYYLTEEINGTDGNITEVNYFEGKGGTNRLTLGVGYRVFKKLSMGIESNIIFGNIQQDVTNLNKNIAFHNHYKKSAELSGTSFKYGISYKDTLRNGVTFKIESSTTFPSQLKSSNEELLYTFMYNNSQIPISQDTIGFNKEQSKIIKCSGQFHLGFGIGRQKKWFTGVEYTLTNPMDFEKSNLLNTSKFKYSDQSRVALGGYYIPRINSITSYWNRVTYRAGAFYEDTGLNIRTATNISYQTINNFGISFGLGLPIGNQMSKLNISVELGQRGTVDNGLVKENYINLRFGLNLTDKWFRKHMID